MFRLYYFAQAVKIYNKSRVAIIFAPVPQMFLRIIAPAIIGSGGRRDLNSAAQVSNIDLGMGLSLRTDRGRSLFVLINPVKTRSGKTASWHPYSYPFLQRFPEMAAVLFFLITAVKQQPRGQLIQIKLFILYSLVFGLSGKEFLIPCQTNTYNRNSQTIHNCLGIFLPIPENELNPWELLFRTFLPE